MLPIVAVLANFCQRSLGKGAESEAVGSEGHAEVLSILVIKTFQQVEYIARTGYAGNVYAGVYLLIVNLCPQVRCCKGRSFEPCKYA